MIRRVQTNDGQKYDDNNFTGKFIDDGDTVIYRDAFKTARMHKMNITRDVETPCFVATSAFDGAAQHPTVMALRTYRDVVLLRSSLGSRFVDLYYDGIGAVAARVLDSVPTLKPLARWGLELLVESITNPAIQKAQYANTPSSLSNPTE